MPRHSLSQPRNVRIGVAWHGRLIHEETLDRRIGVSVGLRAGSTVQLSAAQCPEAPEHTQLLVVQDGRYHVVVPSDPLAQVSLRGTQTVRTAAFVNGQRLLLVDDLPGGTVNLGPLTLLFQFVQADATPQVTRQQVVLRLGLVHDGRLICDRLFQEVRRVSVGTDKSLDIVLPDDDYAGPPVTFRRDRKGGYSASLPADLTLRVAADGAALDVDKLCATGQAKRDGGLVNCALPLGTRGRVVLGAHTLLFQVLTRTVTVAAPRVRPWSERLLGPLMHEPVWTASLLAAVLLLGTLVGQALLYEQTTGHFLRQAPQDEPLDRQWMEIAIAEPEAPQPEPKVEPEPESEKAPVPLEAPRRETPTRTKSPHALSPSRTQAQTPGDPSNRNARALPAPTVASALRDQSGASVKLFQEDASSELRANSSFGHAEASEPGGPGHAGPVVEGGPSGGRTMERILARKIELGPRDAAIAHIKPVVKVDRPVALSPMEGPDDGDKGQIARKIASRAPGVKACYEAALRDNPEVGGKIRVNFTVGTAGTVTDVQVIGAQGTLADCIEAKFRTIRGLPILSQARAFNQTFLLARD